MVVVHAVVEAESNEARGRPVAVCTLREFRDGHESEACVEQEADLGPEVGRVHAQERRIRCLRRRPDPVVAEDCGVARAKRGRNPAIPCVPQPMEARFTQGAATEATSEGDCCEGPRLPSLGRAGRELRGRWRTSPVRNPNLQIVA
jgi:hypothetical protein